jgi:hypothetical protein
LHQPDIGVLSGGQLTDLTIQLGFAYFVSPSQHVGNYPVFRVSPSGTEGLRQVAEDFHTSATSTSMTKRNIVSVLDIIVAAEAADIVEAKFIPVESTQPTSHIKE